jgi:hypothetical protein
LVKLAQLHGIAVTAYSSFGPAVSIRTLSGPQHVLMNGWIELRRTFDGPGRSQSFRS